MLFRRKELFPTRNPKFSSKVKKLYRISRLFIFCFEVLFVIFSIKNGIFLNLINESEIFKLNLEKNYDLVSVTAMHSGTKSEKMAKIKIII